MAGHSQFKNVAPKAHDYNLYRKAAVAPKAHNIKAGQGPCAALIKGYK
jgi:hypothetical protein